MTLYIYIYIYIYACQQSYVYKITGCGQFLTGLACANSLLDIGDSVQRSSLAYALKANGKTAPLSYAFETHSL